MDTGRIVASCNREGVDQCRAAVSFGHRGVHSPVLTPPNRHSSDTPVSLHLRPLSACACPSFLDSPAYDYCSYGCSRARLETRFDLGSGTRISSLPRVMTYSRLSWKKSCSRIPFEINRQGCGVDSHRRCNSNFCGSLHRSRASFPWPSFCACLCSRPAVCLLPKPISLYRVVM